jgi:hypothetical protein
MAASSPVAELFANGRIVDCIVAMMLLELVGLLLLKRRRIRSAFATASIVNLCAGAALLLSLRAALAGYGWHVVACWLVVALFAHLLDLKVRWSAK